MDINSFWCRIAIQKSALRLSLCNIGNDKYCHHYLSSNYKRYIKEVNPHIVDENIQYIKR